jgi:hypothetical protein
MSGFQSPLDRVTVAAPCDAGWENMVGNERVRFCAKCSLNVYNLSGMTKGEAERLVVQAEGRLCVRFYRRTDGTILTKNCPVGLRALRKRAARVATAAASAALSFFAGLLAAAGLRERPPVPAATTSQVIEVQEVMPEGDDPAPTPVMGGLVYRPGGEYVEGRMEIRPPKQRRIKTRW